MAEDINRVPHDDRRSCGSCTLCVDVARDIDEIPEPKNPGQDYKCAWRKDILGMDLEDRPDRTRIVVMLTEHGPFRAAHVLLGAGVTQRGMVTLDNLASKGFVLFLNGRNGSEIAGAPKTVSQFTQWARKHAPGLLLATGSTIPGDA